MSIKPIIFSALMARAICENRKTQTRRIAKPRGAGSIFGDGWDESFILDPANREWALADSRYQTGDILWVKEGWGYAREEFCRCPQPSEAAPCDRWLNGEGCSSTSPEVIYRADHDKPHTWRSPVTMPRWAAREWIKVVDVRVQRLQEISEEDAIAEGVEYVDREPGYPNWRVDGKYYPRPREAYSALWASIHGPESWGRNPWTFAYSFERTERPEGV